MITKQHEINNSLLSENSKKEENLSRQNKVEDAYDELELIGFPQTMSWFELLQRPVNGVVKAGDMHRHIGRSVQMAGLLVTIKYVRTIKKQIMHFAAFLDDTGAFFDSKLPLQADPRSA